eukprot:632529-Pelagomonas_calceolata.AAC.2
MAAARSAEEGKVAAQVLFNTCRVPFSPIQQVHEPITCEKGRCTCMRLQHSSAVSEIRIRCHAAAFGTTLHE